MDSGPDDVDLVARALAGDQQAFDELRAAADGVARGTIRMQVGRFEEAAACIGEVAAIQPGPAVDAARQAGPGQGAGPSSAYVASIDGLDPRS